VSVAELKGFPLLAQLDDAEREAVADELEPLDLAAGIPLFREGEPADGALFVAEGRVRVHSPRAGLDAEFGVGEALGTLSLVVDGPREATAETVSPARIWRLSRSAYRRLAEVAPAAACRLIEGILRDCAGTVREEIRRGFVPSSDAAG
jgi:CRP/FNR family transcriptional regulator